LSDDLSASRLAISRIIANLVAERAAALHHKADEAGLAMKAAILFIWRKWK
jgi:hypothetical protein